MKALALAALRWRKRDLAEYEGNIDVEQALVESMIRVAKEVESRVAALAPLAGH